MMDPNNNKIFYFADLKEFVGIVAHSYSFMADQPGTKNTLIVQVVKVNTAQCLDVAAMLKT